ncbi:MAG: hypothetical protein JWP36_55 [Paucimonas sp.]|nr:hypothetical protein [Paucimonas sp.]
MRSKHPIRALIPILAFTVPMVAVYLTMRHFLKVSCSAILRAGGTCNTSVDPTVAKILFVIGAAGAIASVIQFFCLTKPRL